MFMDGESSLEAWFAGFQKPRLEQWKFQLSPAVSPVFARSGSGDHRFPWGTGPLSIALLVVDYKIALESGNQATFEFVWPNSGESGKRPPSPGKTLNDLLPKELHWVDAMFGMNKKSERAVLDMIQRINPDGRIRTSRIGVRPTAEFPTHIRIYWDEMAPIGDQPGTEITDLEKLHALYSKLAAQFAQKHNAEACRYRPQGATVLGAAPKRRPSPPTITSLAEYLEQIIQNSANDRIAFRFPEHLEPVDPAKVCPERLRCASKKLIALAAMFHLQGDFLNASDSFESAARLCLFASDCRQAAENRLEALALSRPVAGDARLIRQVSATADLFLQPGPLPPWLAGVFISLLSAICHDHGRFEEALLFGRQAEAIFKKNQRCYLDDSYGAETHRKRLFNLARIRQIIGLQDLNSGLNGLQLLGSDFTRAGCPSGFGITHYFAGRLFVSHGQWKEALDYFLSNEPTILHCSIWGQIAFFSTKGALLKKNGRRREAIPILERALHQINESAIRPVLDPSCETPQFDRPHLLLGIQDACVAEREPLSLSGADLIEAAQRAIKRQ
jgi:tetratricopeptide (TPR) repeat protein